MKTISCILFFALFVLFNSTNSLGQVPQSIPYQAVARNNAGDLVVNQPVSLRFTIHDGSSGGTIVYRESHSITTNTMGLFTVNIGQGIPLSGIFSALNWGTGTKFLQVELDITGGSTYIDMGTQQMLSVPYALFSGNGALWTLSNNNITNTNSGNVGIGTSTPTAPLHTVGKVRHESLAGTNNRIVLADPSGHLITARDSTYTKSNNTSQAIPDGSCTGITSTISFFSLPESISPTKISITINITHPLDGDLRIYLVTPNGSILNLAHTNGGAGANFINTVFTNNAAGFLTSGSPPFTGSFKPTGNSATVCSTTPTVNTFSSIGALNPNGNWVLKIFDQGSNGLTGTLNNWSVSIIGPDLTVAGLNNYIPKWSNENLTNTSLLYDDGNFIGIGTNAPSAMLHVENGNVVFTGALIYGDDIPIIGNGARMMWYGANAAFRVGYIDDSSWDEDSIGYYSFATGNNTKAKGDASTAIGGYTSAIGNYSTSMGYGAEAHSLASVAIGRYNEIPTSYSTSSWVSSNPLFIVGNGSSTTSRNNAFTILKNGNVGIGTATPDNNLHIERGNSGISAFTNSILTCENDDYGYISILTPSTEENGILFGLSGGLTPSNVSGGIIYNHTATKKGFQFRTDGNTTRMVIDSSGRVGLGTTVPDYRLELISNSAAKPSSSSWTVSSDSRLKSKVSDFKDGLNVIEKIHPVWFNYNGKANMPTDERGVGTIAQELQLIAPYMVKPWNYTNPTTGEKTEYLAVDYGAMDFILVNSVIELKNQLSEKDKEIQELKNAVSKIQEELSKISSKQE